MKADFLVEIGTEELPPKALLRLAQSLCDEMTGGFSREGLTFEEAKFFATPRRLAVFIKNLDERLPTKELVYWGPPAKVAFDQDGLPTKAALAFANKHPRVSQENLRDHIENDGAQDKLCLRVLSEGGFTQSILERIIEDALAALPIPKRMRWGAKREEFVRPVHWVVLLFGGKTWPYKILGIEAGSLSRGHRFHHDCDVPISSPSSYADDLRSARVIACFEERRELIRTGVLQAAQQAGGRAVIDDDLLDEVTALNEWPVPLVGQFEERFLDVPAEALISSMKGHQKYFHVVDEAQRLLPLFVTVANIDSSAPEKVIAGNERVIRPRLSDAAFFYATDCKRSLEERREQLKAIVFQEKLGSIFDKTERIAQLGLAIASSIGADETNVYRAGQLCKSDLVSEMVLEFDELQGTMGRYYAQNDGEHPEVATAMAEHYQPKFAGDTLPQTLTGTAIALADRLDTLVGIFGIGQPPSGSRDPFALRRASLGVLRLLVDNSIDLNLGDILDKAIALHPGLSTGNALCKQVLTYILERFRSWHEDDGIATEVFMSVQAKGLDNPLDFHLRTLAVHHFSQLPEAAALAAANKRVANILAKVEGDLPSAVDDALFEKEEERTLYQALLAAAKTTAPLLAERQYTQALQALTHLKGPVDCFFDTVMVMVEDRLLRENRLRLLSDLQSQFLKIADISLLAPVK